MPMQEVVHSPCSRRMLAVHIRGNPKPEAVEMHGEGPAMPQSTSASSTQEPAQDGTGVAALAPSAINIAANSHLQLHRLDLIHRSCDVGVNGMSSHHS